jgi:hypothetical protein
VKQYFGSVEQGLDTWMDGDGVREFGIYNVGVTVYETGDRVPSQAVTLATLLDKYLDPKTGMITHRLGDGRASTMDPQLVSHLSPAAMVTIGLRFIVKGPSVESPACELPHGDHATCPVPTPRS